MNINELVGLFYHKLNGPDDATAEDAMRVVVRALRDEIFDERGNASYGSLAIYDLFNQILGDAGEKVVGVAALEAKP